MTKKKAEDTVKPVVKKSKLVSGQDGNVIVNIYTDGHEPQEFRIKIPNITGAANLLHRSPVEVNAAIVSGLRAKYGGRVG